MKVSLKIIQITEMGIIENARVPNINSNHWCIVGFYKDGTVEVIDFEHGKGIDKEVIEP